MHELLGRPTPVRLAPALLAALLLAGCVMPRSVSNYQEVTSASEAGRITLVPITAATLPASAASSASFPAEFLSPGPVDYNLLGAGDVVRLRVIESGPATLFPAGGDLGEAVVDENGRLFVPFVGAVRAAGRTVSQVRAEVQSRLSTVVRRPQVDIRPVTVRSKLVSVQGNAAKAGSYPIDRGRTRLGELLGEAGPDLKNPEMIEVTVRRDGRTGTVRMADVLRNPAMDIALQPGDSIVLNELVQNVTVLGAAGVQGQIRITRRDSSVADVLGQARGLDENAADPRAVFLVRPQAPGVAPLVYQFDMKQPETIALASRFAVQDKDAILISNASFTQTRKVLTAFSQTLTSARAAVTIVP